MSAEPSTDMIVSKDFSGVVSGVEKSMDMSVQMTVQVPRVVLDF